MAQSKAPVLDAKLTFKQPAKAKLISVLDEDSALKPLQRSHRDAFLNDLDNTVVYCTDNNVKTHIVNVFARTVALGDYLVSLAEAKIDAASVPLRGVPVSNSRICKNMNLLYILNDLFYHLKDHADHIEADWFRSTTRTLHPSIVRIITLIAAHDRSAKYAGHFEELKQLLELWSNKGYFGVALMADLNRAKDGKAVTDANRPNMGLKASRGTPIVLPELHGMPFPTPSRSFVCNDERCEHPWLMPAGAIMEAVGRQPSVDITSVQPVGLPHAEPSPDMIRIYAAFKKQADQFEPLPAVAVVDDAGKRADDKLWAPDVDGLGNPMFGVDGRRESAVTAFGLTADFVRRHRSRRLFDGDANAWPVPQAEPPSPPPSRGSALPGGHRGSRGGYRGRRPWR